jgi:hypothetical protein
MTALAKIEFVKYRWVRFWLEGKPVRGSGALAKEKCFDRSYHDDKGLAFADFFGPGKVKANAVQPG